MKITRDHIETYQAKHLSDHSQQFTFLAERLTRKGIDVEKVVAQLQAFQVAIPSWALGTGGTRFGRFPGGGEPATLADKISDVGLLHTLNRSSGAISLHIPWDIPKDPVAIKQLAQSHGLAFDAVNSNTFQDQPGQEKSYKFGSLCHVDASVREQAVAHNLEVIRYGELLGSKSITVWLADGASFPGQLSFRKALENTLASLQQIYAGMAPDWKMYVEYKPFEPSFYATVIPDWGTSMWLCQQLGNQAFSLVDLGHHLPNTNIEQIVATLMMIGKLGGFHFNDSKFADDDLTVGSIKPYQLFLIFRELVDGMGRADNQNSPLGWMIDASHNLKDPLVDLLQSVEAIKIAYAQALITQTGLLAQAQAENDVAKGQEILQDAFRTDVRPLVAEARLREGAALNPIGFYRQAGIRAQLIKERGEKSLATGL
jgi:L-rhamnose isomerase/sugar isomerase